MENIVNKKSMNFKKLEASGDYSKELLMLIKMGNYELLKQELSEDQRKDRRFMDPILYAVKKEKGTYKVFECYADNLKQDEELGREIVKEEPELIIGTPLSNNKQFILEAAEYINPEVVIYMDSSLKSDVIFTGQLCEIENNAVTIYVAKECIMPDTIIENPSLASNSLFMAEAIKKDKNVLEYADASLKNDYNFMQKVARENYGVVSYIIDNGEQFELDSIRGVKEVTQELVVGTSRTIIDKMAQEGVDIRYEKVVKKLDERGKENKYATRWSTAMAAQSGNITPEYFMQVLNDSILAMMEIKKDLTKDGVEKLSSDSALKMVTPQILNKLKVSAIENGLELDENLESKIEEYTEFFNSYRARLQEMKKQNRERAEQIEQPNNGEIALDEEAKDNVDITVEDIEAISEETRLPEEETEEKIVIDGIIKTREEQGEEQQEVEQTREELGE